MAWIKRNLFFVIGAVIALGLLAAAGVYDYTNWQRNKTALDTLNQTYDTLRRLNGQTPSPGNDQINNIENARQQEQQLQGWIEQAGKYFQSIPPVPNTTNGVISDAQFAAARDHTLSQLQAEANDASVTLPPAYGFSFEAERASVKFASGSLPALAQQLGDVKTIAEILYSARVNALDGIRRPIVSPDDTGPQSDFLNSSAVTNGIAVFIPYEVTFRGFSQNLANVLVQLASSPHGFIVKAINVQPAAAMAVAASDQGGPPGAGPYGLPPSYPQRPYAPATLTTLRSSGGLQTMLNEQLLSITLDIEIVKLLPEK